MNKVFLFSLLAILGVISNYAQEVNDGFYRVQNYGTKRYAYVYDCTGSINVQATTADMGAIVLFSDANKRLTDPASVIYISQKGTASNNSYYYDLEAQGTGVHKIINYYVTVTNSNVAGTYWVYESQYSQYLCDPVSSQRIEKSYVDTKKVQDPQLRCWSISPVDSNTDEYLGVSPETSMQLGGKYYKPYYVGFAMDFVSNGMKAYYISDVKSDAVIIKEIVGTVPAATPIIIECNSPDAFNNRINPSRTSITQIKDNKLSGNYFCYGSHSVTDRHLYNAATMRVLAVKNGCLQFISDVNHEYTKQLSINGVKDYYIPANSSYLQVPAGTAADLPVMTQAEYDALHPATKKGDINGDGSVNSTDALVLNRIIASGKTAAQNPEADINGDGQVNSTDALVLNRIIASGK